MRLVDYAGHTPLWEDFDGTTGSVERSLGDGVARPVGARIDWANLLRCVYLEDVLSCPCGGRRSIIADIVEPDAVAAILSHLGLPAEAPPIARARCPSEDAA